MSIELLNSNRNQCLSRHVIASLHVFKSLYILPRNVLIELRKCLLKAREQYYCNAGKRGLHYINLYSRFFDQDLLYLTQSFFEVKTSLAGRCVLFLWWVKNVKLASGHVTLIEKWSDALFMFSLLRALPERNPLFFFCYIGRMVEAGQKLIK